MDCLLREEEAEAAIQCNLYAYYSKGPEAASKRKRWTCEEINAIYDIFAGIQYFVNVQVDIQISSHLYIHTNA